MQAEDETAAGRTADMNKLVGQSMCAIFVLVWYASIHVVAIVIIDADDDDDTRSSAGAHKTQRNKTDQNKDRLKLLPKPN